MRMSKMLGRRIKEDPKDAKTVSHKFLVRGGYIRLVSAGIYSLLPPAKRIIAKIEQIVREEQDRAGQGRHGDPRRLRKHRKQKNREKQAKRHQRVAPFKDVHRCSFP